MKLKKKKFGLAAFILMSLSGSVYAEAPLTDSTVINGDTTINVDTGANSGINLSGNKEISLAASASDAAVTIKVNGQKSIGDVRYGIRVSNGAKINLSDLNIVSEDKTGDVNGIYASASEININNLNVDVNGNSIYGVNIYNGSQMNVAGNMTIAVKGDTVPSSGIRGVTVNSVSGVLNVQGDLIIKAESDQRGYGIYNTSGGKLNVAQNTYITTIGETGHAIFSASNNDAGRIGLSGNLNIDSYGDKSYGIRVIGGTVDVQKNTVINMYGNNTSGIHTSKDGNGLVEGVIDLHGDTIIKAEGNGNKGIYASTGLITMDGKGYLQMDGNKSYGIYVDNGGKVVLNGGVSIDAQKEGNQGIYIYGSGNVELHDSVDIFTGSDAAANAININGKGSTAENKAQVNGTAQFNMLGNIKVSNGGSIDLEMTERSFWQGAAGIDAGNGSTSSLSFGNNAVWKLTGNSEVTDLTLDGAWLDMTADGNAFSTLKTESLNGSGGTIILDVDGTAVDQADKLYVTDTFTGTQALKLHEINGRDNDPTLGKDALGTILASVNINNGTFTAVDGEGSLFWQRYELGQQASNTGGYTTDWYLKEIENISPAERPTTTVESVLAAGALNYYTWRSENDKLMQRMGELRHNGDDAKGVWFRVNGSKIGRSGSWGFENKYTAYELGYDEVIKRTDDFVRYNGVALNYTDGSSSYRSGNGGNDAKAISFYGTQIGSKGHYLDVLFKISRLANDFTVYDSNANKITGELGNVGVAVSAEYGRKNLLSRGWYIEPQAQLTLGYLGGDSYQTSNGITVHQDGINSAVGRVGFNLGREIGNQANIYVKANLLHEFGGGYDVTMADSGGNRFKAADVFNDTWFEYGIGAALKTGSNSHIYIDVERSSGSDFKKDWQWNAGARWTF
ncbi:autotransporter outer membrane beta-barrel domain-containing protein [Phascolarctobacterium faecium]|uniref:autotransporter outer membrane beta-barrel domain-containing protein n=1 Tax=Phascolarctobacterium faecium TaxID=33025 RepID=UPI00210A4581|nr:autotransporter outer membrane beta-barrel domain-containing protein [Phascolarctobacterium faecium]MCQ5185011.1 autotransporter outer membrane beta-barrel domain-containing protein [Phascolarctobacterium faecium]